MPSNDQAVFRSDEGPVISVTQITEHEVKFRFVSYIASYPLVVFSTESIVAFQDLMTRVEYKVHKTYDHATDVTVEDLENAGISIAQEVLDV